MGYPMKPIHVGSLLKSGSFGLRYVIGHRVLGKTVPLIRGLVLTNRCNLRCRHCRLEARGPRDLPFAEVVAAIDAYHHDGGRCLYLEGGEPFLWRDGQKGLDAVVDYAHGLGFLTVVVYTNGTFFYFHTPYYGYDELYVEPPERRRILEQLLELRKRYRILNSRAGLLCALRNDWNRPVTACSVYEKGVVFACCRFSHDADLCRNCGYLSYAEVHQTLKLKPSAVLNAIKYF